MIASGPSSWKSGLLGPEGESEKPHIVSTQVSSQIAETRLMQFQCLNTKSNYGVGGTLLRRHFILPFCVFAYVRVRARINRQEVNDRCMSFNCFPSFYYFETRPLLMNLMLLARLAASESVPGVPLSLPLQCYNPRQAPTHLAFGKVLEINSGPWAWAVST